MIPLFEIFIPVLPIFFLLITMIVVFICIALKLNFYNMNIVITFFSLSCSIALIFLGNNKGYRWYSELFIIDKYSKISMFFLLLASFYTCIFSSSWIISKMYNKIEFLIFLLLSTIGGLIILISNHIATLFIGIELLFLPALGIVGYMHNLKKTIFFTLKYMILSIFSSLMMLFGCLIIYSATGQLCFSHISNMFLYYPSLMLDKKILFGLITIFISFFFKLSLFPLYLWTPDIYNCMSAFSLIYFSIATKISIFTFLLRFLFGIPALYYCKIIYILLIIAATCSIFFGNCMAFFQKNINRLIAYSSVTNTGYLLLILVILLNQVERIFLEGFYIYFFGYILSMICFFSIKSYIDYKFFYNNYYQYNNCLQGLYWKNPILCFCMTLLLLSLAGFPFTFGFWGKFFLFRFLLHNKLWFILLIILFSNIIGMQCYLPIISSLFQKKYGLLDISNVDSLLEQEYINIQYFFILFLSFLFFILGFFPQKVINIINIF
ncbi:NADH-quinone oxidoreductase subunit N [Buchnera aphidicola]|uniref:NADH-quinone oxidoreductase subunit N n=1 Tax=Buchnera aphidicola TaxID=9 RepID=UPI00094BEC5E|nr:NADH-quinone oxidoreductase subunit N [Buchnera aphidicola]